LHSNFGTADAAGLETEVPPAVAVDQCTGTIAYTCFVHRAEHVYVWKIINDKANGLRKARPDLKVLLEKGDLFDVF
jgi:hypothetical protein